MQEYNKKIMIRVMSIISLIVNIYALIASVAIYFLAPYVEEISEILKENEFSIIPQIIILGICIILSILNLILSKNFQKNEDKIALVNAITMLIGSVYNIIAGFVIGIVIYKKKKGEEEKTRIDKLEDVKILNRWIYAILFIVLFVALYTSIIVNLVKDWNVWVKIFIFYFGRVLFVVIPFYKILKRDIQMFIKEKGNYIKEIIKTFSIMLLFYLPATLIVKLIVGDESTNQSSIQEIPIWLTAILAVIIAPISEEIMFRGFLRKIFKNDTVFIIISAIIFGIIHCMYVEENLLMYLYIIPYAIMGAGFAKIYAKTNNIITNIALHFIWNLIVLGCMLIMSVA